MLDPRPRLRAAFARVSPVTILAIGWALFLIYAYPGYMSKDSFDQLLDSRWADYRDWHPPLMARIWSVVEIFVTGPFGMLLLQSGMFLFGLYYVFRRVASHRAASLAAVCVMLFPPVMTTMAVIWKDSQMAGFLMIGAAGLLSAHRNARLAGYAMLFFACAMRYNAAAALLPLILFATWRNARPRWQRAGIAGAITVALFASSMLVAGWLTSERTYPWHSSIALADIAGTIVEAGPAPDAEIRRRLDGVPLAANGDLYAKIAAVYDPRSWWGLTHFDQRIFDSPRTAEQRDAITRAWRRLVFDEPGAYLRHRWNVFEQLLGTRPLVRNLWSPVYHAIGEQENQAAILHHDASPSTLQKWLYKRIDHFQNGRWFRPYIYFHASLLALLVCAVRRRTFQVAFLVSGLLYELSFFFLAPSPDNRYSHWMFTCLTVAVALAALTRPKSGTFQS